MSSDSLIDVLERDGFDQFRDAFWENVIGQLRARNKVSEGVCTMLAEATGVDPGPGDGGGASTPARLGREKTLTPYWWCHSHCVKDGDSVVMTEKGGKVTEFVIVKVEHEQPKPDHVPPRVRWSLEGVWRDREWLKMDPDAKYARVLR